MGKYNVYVYPSRLSVVYQTERDNTNMMIEAYSRKHFDFKNIKQYKSNFLKKNNPFVLSRASKKKLFDSINYLYTLSNYRDIKMKSGKTIYKFKASFITLTLPAKQEHTDTFIKSQCINQLFIELSKHYGFKNYVWKAELQKNNNIHFHLITDSYIDYQALRRRWNRILNKLGYIDKYSNKFKNMTFKIYNELSIKQGSNDIKKNYERYNKGKNTNWSNPNTVDIKSIYSKKELAMYLGKYITKRVNAAELNEEELERQTTFGRSWGRSSSLANIKSSLAYGLEEFKEMIEYFKTIPDKVKEVKDTFFEVYFFSLEELNNITRRYLKMIIKNTASYYHYSSA